MDTPSPKLPEMSVSPALEDPITLSDPAFKATPVDPLPSPAVPAALVPMRLPAIVFMFAPPTATRTPLEPLPEITLMRLARFVRPIRFPAEFEIRIPWPPLGCAAVPAKFVPM